MLCLYIIMVSFITSKMSLADLFIVPLVAVILVSITVSTAQGSALEFQELYNQTTDFGISILTTENFNETLFVILPDNDNTLCTDNVVWLVQFYNSWCGHCQHFAPSYKSVANSTIPWREFVKVGVVDCSVRKNSPLCNQYDVQMYPTIMFFPPKTKVGALGKKFTGPHTVPGLYNGILDYLDQEGFPPEMVLVTSSTIDELWNSLPEDKENLALIVEPIDSSLGKDVLLSTLGDLHVLTARRITVLNRALVEALGDVAITGPYPQLWLLDRKAKTSNKIAVSSGGSEDLIAAIFAIDDELAVQKGIVKPVRHPVHYMEADHQVETPVKKADSMEIKPEFDHVQSLDITSAIIYMFSTEVATHKTIDGEQLVALRRFVKALTDLVPLPSPANVAFQKLSGHLAEVTFTEPKRMLKALSAAGYDVEKLPVKWVGCAGSQPGRRGYPCGLWQLLHTLTVNTYRNNTNTEGTLIPTDKETEWSSNALDEEAGILTTIFGYIRHFFSCDDCRLNFLREADGLKAQTKSMSNEEAVLWLWKVHNGVNRRLVGDITEDPAHPKIQFPSQTQCPQCRLADNSFDEHEVKNYFLRFYEVKDVPTTWNVRDPKHRQLVAAQEGSVNGEGSSKKVTMAFGASDTVGHA
ncbi:hypothetical protein RvY_17563-2 [Ramazzottius varieornatus]|uniref:Sulfhydryl oxidase n=1 Tax=Ramazzottius varieornatus TaxID=947166 RepID=A0A1D1W6D5_RAMVA|nr:hypothetical protein RvY_17563-2 [Ramazzottius varieornatus]